MATCVLLYTQHDIHSYIPCVLIYPPPHDKTDTHLNRQASPRITNNTNDHYLVPLDKLTTSVHPPYLDSAGHTTRCSVCGPSSSPLITKFSQSPGPLVSSATRHPSHYLIGNTTLTELQHIVYRALDAYRCVHYTRLQHNKRLTVAIYCSKHYTAPQN